MKARNLLALVLALVMAFTLTACGGSSEDSAAAEENYEAPQEMANGSLTSESETAADLPADRKLIRTFHINAETEELDTLLTALDQKIAELDGYVENREVYNGSTHSSRRYRNANLTVRIPAGNVNGFVAHVSGVSNVVSSNESVDDVTLTYVDTEARVSSLETEQDRLLELMEKADNLSDLLKIEDRLTEVRYKLESYASRLKTLDNQVSYATVHLNITEVQEYTPVAEKTTWQRITEGFVGSLEGIWSSAVEIFVWVLVNSPYLVLFGGIAVLVVVFLRKRKKPVNKAPRKDEKSES